MSFEIPVSSPAFLGNEKSYVADCVDSTWISSIGVYIGRFEAAFAELCGVRHALACSNGTTALHLALLGAGIGPGDEVLVPSLTYIASANAVRYCGAEPVFVDSERDSWNLDPADVRRKIGPRTKAILPVHLYGKPAAMAEIVALASEQGLMIVEDAAEAVGARLDGRAIGSFGKIATWSFFGNKILTCGEGGMVTTDDDELARHMRQLKGQGQDPGRRYWFPIVGYNYRMTNIQAALGLAQLEKLDQHLAARDEIASWYAEGLAERADLAWPQTATGERPVCWLWSLVLTGHVLGARDRAMAALAAVGIETRPFFFPCHTLPPYRTERDSDCPNAEWLGARGLSLPTWVGLRREQVDRVCRTLTEVLDRELDRAES